MNYIQTITFRSEHGDEIAALLQEWDHIQASSEVTGYIGVRMLADREDPGRYMIIADFAAPDPVTSAADEAELNNAREQTQEWDRRFRELVDGEPTYHNHDELYRTG